MEIVEQSMLQLVMKTLENMQQQLNELAMSKAKLTSDLVNEKQAAEYLGIKPATLRAWRNQSIGPRYLKIGKCVKYSINDLQSYVKEQTVAR
jgi:hypothetical protein